MSESRPTGLRVPSPWWVLLPGVLLALAGARAVTSEADRARVEARDAARVAATRVARSFGTLVDEYAAPLPGPDTAIPASRVADVTRHLVSGFAITPDGDWIGADEEPSLPPAVRERDAAIAREVIELASADDLEPSDAAALLSAAATSVECPSTRALLFTRAAEQDLAAGDAATAYADLRRALAMLPAPDATESVESEPFEAAVELLPLVIGAAAERSEDLAWVQGVVDWAARSSARGANGAPPSGELSMTLRTLGSQGEITQRDTEVVTWSEGRLLVARDTRIVRGAYETLARVGGEVPAPTLGDRVLSEVTAVGSELAATAVIRTPDGAVALPETGSEAARPQDSEDRISTVVDVPGVATGWSVEASVERPSGLPASALILAAAVVAAILALGVGAFAMSRAARHHARLAEERRSFLDHVAHEVRTPAASLLALSDELNRGHVAPERTATYHEHLAREARRLADLVEETLDLTRLEGGRLVSKRLPLDVREVVLDAVDSARAEDGRVEVSLPDDEVAVLADRSALRRAIRNLVDNALKHGVADAPVEVTVRVAGGNVTVEVRDHGRGIPAEHVARVFERFHRVPSETHEVKGVGLGLALVREVAIAHDGTATAENAPGGGARFVLRLPVIEGGGA